MGINMQHRLPAFLNAQIVQRHMQLTIISIFTGYVHTYHHPILDSVTLRLKGQN